MRKIALLAVVAFAAACGSSSSTPGTGYLRVANLAPDVPTIDFCVRISGTTTWSAPVMAGVSATAGIVYGGAGAQAGLLQMSKYFPYEAGTYDVAVFNKALLGASCANPQKTLSNLSLGDGTYKLVALVGIPAGTGTAATAEKLVAFTDMAAAPAGKAAVRVVNAGILAIPSTTPDVLPAFDLGITVSTVYTKIFGNVAYPTFAATGVDANGYAALDPAGLPSSGLSLTVCVPAGSTPTTGQCQSTLVPPGSITANIVASVYVIGKAPLAPGALFCGDTTPAAVPNYSACTSALQ
jgi:hypothetical protein